MVGVRQAERRGRRGYGGEAGGVRAIASAKPRRYRPKGGDPIRISEAVPDLEQYDASAAVRKRCRDFTVVETPLQLRSMLQELQHVDSLAIDCEGLNLGQPEGQLCLLQLAARRSSHAAASGSTPMPQLPVPAATMPDAKGAASEVKPPASGSRRPSSKSPPLSLYIVDVHQLQWRAFHHRLDPSDLSSISLKGLLESKSCTKLVYDVRSDASNLTRQFNVLLKGAYDLQLAEVAVRQLRGTPASWVLPLEKSLSNWLPRSAAMDEDLLHGHYVAKHYHQGNRMEVWQERPLLEEMLHYAAADVRYLHLLADVLNRQLPPAIVQKVSQATTARIRGGDLPGASRSSAPSIVRPHDVTRLTQDMKMRDRDRRVR